MVKQDLLVFAGIFLECQLTGIGEKKGAENSSWLLAFSCTRKNGLGKGLQETMPASGVLFSALNINEL